jgi:hypothetical protein
MQNKLAKKISFRFRLHVAHYIKPQESVQQNFVREE